MRRRRDFRGKVVAITGAAGGIGAALARRFACAGANLVLIDRDGDAVRTLVLTAVGRLSFFANRFFPASYEWLMTRSIRRELGAGAERS